MRPPAGAASGDVPRGPKLPDVGPARVQLPHADRWGQPDCEGCCSPSDEDILELEDDSLVDEDTVAEREEKLVESPRANGLVDVYQAPPDTDPLDELNGELSHDGDHRGRSKGLSVDSGFSGVAGFQRMLLELSAEYNRVVAQLHRMEVQQVQAGAGEIKTVEEGQVLEPMPMDEAPVIAEKDIFPAHLPSFPVATIRTNFSTLQLTEKSSNHPRYSPFDISTTHSKHLTREGTSALASIKEFLWQMLLGSVTLSTCTRAVKKLCIRMFEGFSCIAILSNAVLYGHMANSIATNAFEGGNPDVDSEFNVISISFTAWYCFELLLRLLAAGPRQYFFSEEWTWNLFDMVMVLIDVGLTLLEQLNVAADAQHLMIVRMFRVLRIVRAVRFVRVFRFFRELRMMVSSILRSGSSLFWTLMLLGLTIYTFAIYFIHVVSEHVMRSGGYDADDDAKLMEMFGNLLRAEYTLYMAVCGGISWGEVNSLLLEIHVLHGIIFCFFTFFTTFALLNIITGIFVETSINSAKSTREEVAQEQMNANSGFREEMKKIFVYADQDKSGTISLEEFEVMLSMKEVDAYLEALGIEVDKAKSLFQLLDLDMSGELTYEEFTFGCMRLKGGAKSIDLATLMMHTRRMADQWQRFFTWTESQFKQLHDFQSRVEDRLALCCAIPSATIAAAHRQEEDPASGA